MVGFAVGEPVGHEHVPLVGSTADQGLELLGDDLRALLDLEVGDVVHTLGDAHLYLNHRDQARLQLARTPGPLPRLRLRRVPASLFEYEYDDILIEDYAPQPHIKAPVAV